MRGQHEPHQVKTQKLRGARGFPRSHSPSVGEVGFESRSDAVQSSVRPTSRTGQGWTPDSVFPYGVTGDSPLASLGMRFSGSQEGLRSHQGEGSAYCGLSGLLGRSAISRSPFLTNTSIHRLRLTFLSTKSHQNPLLVLFLSVRSQGEGNSLLVRRPRLCSLACY